MAALPDGADDLGNSFCGSIRRGSRLAERVGPCSEASCAACMYGAGCNKLEACWILHMSLCAKLATGVACAGCVRQRRRQRDALVPSMSRSIARGQHDDSTDASACGASMYQTATRGDPPLQDSFRTKVVRPDRRLALTGPDCNPFTSKLLPVRAIAWPLCKTIRADSQSITRPLASFSWVATFALGFTSH
jgi:hypothetical protein